MGPIQDKAAVLAAASIACGAVDGTIAGLIARSKAIGAIAGLVSAIGMGFALCLVSHSSDGELPGCSYGDGGDAICPGCPMREECLVTDEME